jgi:hypothetical protein
MFLAVSVPITGCARYYYGKPGAAAWDFKADSIECAHEVGIPSGNAKYALAAKDPFRSCMTARGWQREKKVEPVAAGWFRGVEGDDVVDLTLGRPSRPTLDDCCRAPRCTAALCM